MENLDVPRKGRMSADLTGLRVGRLVVQRRASEWRVKGRTQWECLCDCGAVKIATHCVLQSESVRSCGCLRAEVSARHAIAMNLPEHREWRALLDTLCEEVLSPHPMHAHEIRAALSETWGSCGDRRFWRALEALVADGRVLRVGKPRSRGPGASEYVLAPTWPRNLAACIADAAATYAVYELGMRRAA